MQDPGMPFQLAETGRYSDWTGQQNIHNWVIYEVTGLFLQQDDPLYISDLLFLGVDSCWTKTSQFLRLLSRYPYSLFSDSLRISSGLTNFVQTLCRKLLVTALLWYLATRISVVL